MYLSNTLNVLDMNCYSYITRLNHIILKQFVFGNVYASRSMDYCNLKIKL